jgi:hypothetical protein
MNLKRKLTTGEKVAFGFVWVAMIYGGWTLITSTGGPSSSVSRPATAEQKTYSDVEALVEAEHIVSGYLKAPSTAQFPSMSDATIEDLANNGFKVSSYVDSQNGFGAMIRSNWTVLFEYTDNDMVNIYQVIVDGEALYTRDTKSTSK